VTITKQEPILGLCLHRSSCIFLLLFFTQKNKKNNDNYSHTYNFVPSVPSTVVMAKHTRIGGRKMDVGGGRLPAHM